MTAALLLILLYWHLKCCRSHRKEKIKVIFTLLAHRPQPSVACLHWQIHTFGNSDVCWTESFKYGKKHTFTIIHEFMCSYSTHHPALYSQLTFLTDSQLFDNHTPKLLFTLNAQFPRLPVGPLSIHTPFTQRRRERNMAVCIHHQLMQTAAFYYQPQKNEQRFNEEGLTWPEWGRCHYQQI